MKVASKEALMGLLRKAILADLGPDEINRALRVEAAAKANGSSVEDQAAFSKVLSDLNVEPGEVGDALKTCRDVKRRRLTMRGVKKWMAMDEELEGEGFNVQTRELFLKASKRFGGVVAAITATFAVGNVERAAEEANAAMRRLDDVKAQVRAEEAKYAERKKVNDDLDMVYALGFNNISLALFPEVYKRLDTAEKKTQFYKSMREYEWFQLEAEKPRMVKSIPVYRDPEMMIKALAVLRKAFGGARARLMIDGIEIKEIIKNIDERGFFSELLRSDWNDCLNEDQFVQLNLSYSYPGIVRAWHRHLRGQNDYFLCVDGSVKICAYDDRENSKTYGELDEIVLSGERLRVARIPGILWHGYHAIGSNPVKVLYGVNRLYEYNDPDEERRPWDDSKIVPTSINGKTNDPRVGKSWNWYYSPNK